MKLFLDTNVLLDVLMENRPNHMDSATILRIVEKGVATAVITTQSIIDASYVYSQREKQSLKQFIKAIDTIMDIVEVEAITGKNITAAMRMPFNDFEDAAQIACSEMAGCDIIITSDHKFREYTFAPVYTPKSFCKEVFV